MSNIQVYKNTYGYTYKYFSNRTFIYLYKVQINLPVDSAWVVRMDLWTWKCAVTNFTRLTNLNEAAFYSQCDWTGTGAIFKKSVNINKTYVVGLCTLPICYRESFVLKRS